MALTKASFAGGSANIPVTSADSGRSQGMPDAKPSVY
jgi:hypothetical protein